MALGFPVDSVMYSTLTTCIATQEWCQNSKFTTGTDAAFGTLSMLWASISSQASTGLQDMAVKVRTLTAQIGAEHHSTLAALRMTTGDKPMGWYRSRRELRETFAPTYINERPLEVQYVTGRAAATSGMRNRPPYVWYNSSQLTALGAAGATAGGYVSRPEANIVNLAANYAGGAGGAGVVACNWTGGALGALTDSKIRFYDLQMSSANVPLLRYDAAAAHSVSFDFTTPNAPLLAEMPAIPGYPTLPLSVAGFAMNSPGLGAAAGRANFYLDGCFVTKDAYKNMMWTVQDPFRYLPGPQHYTEMVYRDQYNTATANTANAFLDAVLVEVQDRYPSVAAVGQSAFSNLGGMAMPYVVGLVGMRSIAKMNEWGHGDADLMTTADAIMLRNGLRELYAYWMLYTNLVATIDLLEVRAGIV